MEEVLSSREDPVRHDAPKNAYTRREINGHWVEYTFYKDGEERRVAFPRIQIISDEVILAKDREAQAAAAEAVDSTRPVD